MCRPIMGERSEILDITIPWPADRLYVAGIDLKQILSDYIDRILYS